MEQYLMGNLTSSFDNGSTTANATGANFTLNLADAWAFYVALYYRAVPITFSLMSITGIIGNSLVIAVAVKNRKMQTLNNKLITFLGVADLCFVVICVPTTAISYAMPVWPFGLVWCKLSHYLIFVSVEVTIYLLCIMSAERFFAIVFPMKRSGMDTSKYIQRCCVAAVLMASGISTPALLVYDILPSVNVFGQYMETCSNSPEIIAYGNVPLSKAFFISFLICSYVIPLVILVVMYTGIFIKLITLPKIGATASSKSNRHARAAKISLVLQVCFIICFTPIHVMNVADKILMVLTESVKDPRTLSALFVSANILSYLNSCLNPILYTFVSSEYRSRLVALFVKR